MPVHWFEITLVLLDDNEHLAMSRQLVEVVTSLGGTTGHSAHDEAVSVISWLGYVFPGQSCRMLIAYTIKQKPISRGTYSAIVGSS